MFIPTLLANSQQDIATLKRLVLKQQVQLAEQSREIHNLQKKMARLTNTTVYRQPRNLQTNKTYRHTYAKKRKIAPVNMASNNAYQDDVLFHNVTHASFITAGKPMDLRIYGQVNQAALYSDDGEQRDLFFVSNNNSIPRLNIRGEIKPNNDIEVGGQIELGFKVNSSDEVSQDDHSPSSSIDMRRVEVFVFSKYLGKLWLGKGSTASDNTAEVDLSGTDVIGYASVSDMGGGLYFRTPHSREYTNNPQVYEIFNDLDGFGRRSRVRYDTPRIYGFSLSTSAIEDNNQDVALTYKQNVKGTKIAGAVAYTSPNELQNNDGNVLARGNILDGSISLLLDNGLNGTIAGGKLKSDITGRKDTKFYYVKLGYQKKFFPIGKTALSADMGEYKALSQNSDVGRTYAADIVQNIVNWNLAIYAGYRKFKLSRRDARFNDIDIAATGAIFKF